jgi:hypothetical protein
MVSAFDLMRLTLPQFTHQRTSLCVKSASGDLWLVPDVEAAQRLVTRGVSRGQVSTVAEMAEMAEMQTTTAVRTIAGLLSAGGVDYGEVVAENA